LNNQYLQPKIDASHAFSKQNFVTGSDCGPAAARIRPKMPVM